VLHGTQLLLTSACLGAEGYFYSVGQSAAFVDRALLPFAGTQNCYIEVTVFSAGYSSDSLLTKNWRFVIMAKRNVTVKGSYTGNEQKRHNTNDSSVRLPKQRLSCHSL
jgi:hypothetical protein